MKILHECEDPRAIIGAGLAQAFPDALLILLVSGIEGNPAVRQLTLCLSEPSSLEGCVGQQKEGQYGHAHLCLC